MMSDATGRWFRFVMTLDTVVVLERKDLPEHLTKLDIIEQPTTMSELVKSLEDAGEDSWTMVAQFFSI